MVRLIRVRCRETTDEKGPVVSPQANAHDPARSAVQQPPFFSLSNHFVTRTFQPRAQRKGGKKVLQKFDSLSPLSSFSAAITPVLALRSVHIRPRPEGCKIPVVPWQKDSSPASNQRPARRRGTGASRDRAGRKPSQEDQALYLFCLCLFPLGFCSPGRNMLCTPTSRESC